MASQPAASPQTSDPSSRLPEGEEDRLDLLDPPQDPPPSGEPPSPQEPESPEPEADQSPTKDSPSSDDLPKEEEEEEPAAEEPPEAEPPKEEEPPAELEPFEGYASFDAVKLDDFDEASRPRVEAIMGLVEPALANAEAKAQEFDEARQELVDMMSSIREEGVDGPALARRFEEQSNTINALNSDMGRMAFNAFKRLHPECDSMPGETARLFSGLVGEKLYNFGAEDDTPLERMEEILRYAAFKTGWDGRAGEPAKEEPPAPAVSSKAAKQALIADDEAPPTPSHRSVDDQSWDEIIEEGMHLL